MADINSSLPVTDTTDGTIGSASPTSAQQVGGSDGTNLRAISTDSTGKVNINNVSGTVSLPTGASTEATLAKLALAQGSTTSGQSGSLILGAVSTGSPTYSNGASDPLSLTMAGALRTDATATQQPVVGTGSNGSPNGGVLSIQGVSGGTVVPSNITQFGSSAVATGTGVSGVGIPRVTISNDSNILVTQSGTWSIAGTITLPTGASTSANQTNASQKTQVVDGSGNVIGSYNDQLSIADILNVGSQYRAQSITTSAAEALGGASILANRKLLSITPTNGIIYYGYNSSVTTVTGSPLFPNNTLWLSVGSNTHIFLIAATTTDARIGELS